jgi:hypothetical protein
MSYYDDNFGHWEEMDDPDMVDFYHKVQRESVEKVCERCERTVRLRPEYSICNDCADAIEGGF